MLDSVQQSVRTGTSLATWFTLLAAVIAAIVSLIGIYFLRKTGSEASLAAQKSANAAERSSKAAAVAASATELGAAAAAKSANAAEHAVVVNARSADAAERSADAALASAEASDLSAQAAGIRAQEDSRWKRYQDAAVQLGHDRATVRLAGVYALASLADQWDEQRQMCVDVLCAYLRMPWPQELDGTVVAGDEQVRRSIISVINQRTSTTIQPAASWAACRFDLHGAHLRDFILVNCIFDVAFSFTEATFEGRSVLKNIAFRKGGYFSDCKVTGLLEVSNVAGSVVKFEGTVVTADAEMIIRPAITQDLISSPLELSRLHVSGTVRIVLATGKAAQPRLAINFGDLQAGGQLEVRKAIDLTKDTALRHLPRVQLNNWSAVAPSTVSILQSLIDDGTVDWMPSAIEEGVALTFIGNYSEL